MAGQRKNLACAVRLSAASGLLLPVVGFAQASEGRPAVEDWRCELCIGSPGWLLDLEAGPALGLDDAFRFGDYSGLESEEAYLLGDLSGRYRDTAGRFARFEGYSRGESAYGLFAEAGRQGRYAARLAIQSMPRNVYDALRTPFRQIGGPELRLPQTWVTGPTTQQMTQLDAVVLPFELGYGYERLGLGVELSPRRDLELSVDFRRQQREGVARASGAVLFSALEFASPVDYVTNDVEVAFSYSKARWQASGSYFGSVFENGHRGVEWDNPYTPIRGATAGRQALAPDNEAHRVSLAGSVTLPARTVLSGHLSVGRLTQDESLLPYTTNPTLPVGPLPAATAGAEADTRNLDLRIVSSPSSRLTLQGELRRNDFDNTTPVNVYDYVVTDAFPADAPVGSTAYDYERRQLAARGEYRIAADARLAFGFDRERFERAQQDRHRTTTERVWASARLDLADVAELFVEVFDERRDGSSYEAVIAPLAPRNPLMRKFNMADRQRRGSKLRGSFFGSSRADFGLEVEFDEDRYDASLLGLTDTDYRRVGADFSFLLADSRSLYASVYNERIETRQANSQSFALPDWAATTHDEFDTATLGLVYPALFDRIDAELELTASRSTGETRNDTRGLVSTFPDLESRRRTLRLSARYPFSATLEFGLHYFFERLRSDDWALDGVGLATVPSLLSLGAAPWRYDANVVYFSVQYRIAPPPAGAQR